MGDRVKPTRYLQNRLAIHLPPELRARLEKVMEQTSLQRSTVIRMMVEAGLREWEAKQQK